MSGKRRLSSAGKWLLDSSGKAKICTCCDGGGCACIGKCYLVTVNSIIMESGCSCPAMVEYIETTYTDFSFGSVPSGDCTSSGIFGIEAVGYCDGFWAGGFTAWAEGDCPVVGTANYPFTISDGINPPCTGTVNATIEEIACTCPDTSCFSVNFDYRWEQWCNTDPEAITLPDCTDPLADPGVYKSCDVTGNETAFLVSTGPCEWYGEVLTDNGPSCSVLIQVYLEYDTMTGVWTLNVDPWNTTTKVAVSPVGAFPDALVACNGAWGCIDKLTVTGITIEEVNCCTEIADGDEPTYYLSFDSVFTWHSDVDGDMVDCDGTGGGSNTVEECSTTDTYTDLVGNTAIGDDVCSYFFTHAGNCWLSTNGINIYGLNGEWYLGFPTEHDFYLGNVGTVKSGGMTPVGTYPDIAICYNDGTVAFRLDITNIVVTA